MPEKKLKPAALFGEDGSLDLNLNVTGFPTACLELILKTLVEKGDSILATLADLKEQVNRNTAVTQSAITLIQELAQKIEDLKDDPQELQALANELKGSADALASAVTANTTSE